MDWNDDIVTFLELIRAKSVDLSARHQENFFYYKSCENYFQIPTIVLSVFSSFISVGVSDFVSQPTISTTTASISMAIAILGSVRPRNSTFWPWTFQRSYFCQSSCANRRSRSFWRRFTARTSGCYRSRASLRPSTRLRRRRIS